MVVNRVRGDEQRRRHRGDVQAPHPQLGDLTLAGRQTVGGDDDRRQLGGPGRLDDDDAAILAQPGAVQDEPPFVGDEQPHDRRRPGDRPLGDGPRLLCHLVHRQRQLETTGGHRGEELTGLLGRRHHLCCVVEDHDTGPGVVGGGRGEQVTHAQAVCDVPGQTVHDVGLGRAERRPVLAAREAHVAPPDGPGAQDGAQLVPVPVRCIEGVVPRTAGQVAAGGRAEPGDRDPRAPAGGTC